MKLTQHKKSVAYPLQQTNLVFLRRGDEILLAMKKRGFGAGRWNGVGGKMDEGETIEDAAIRETKEEIGVLPKSLKHVAILDFYFLHNPPGKVWDQQVLSYFVSEWEGEPIESEEMAPKWYDVSKLPFKDMWPDDPHWLPPAIDGNFVTGEFLFGDNGGILDFKVKTKKI